MNSLHVFAGRFRARKEAGGGWGGGPVLEMGIGRRARSWDLVLEVRLKIYTYSFLSPLTAIYVKNHFSSSSQFILDFESMARTLECTSFSNHFFAPSLPPSLPPPPFTIQFHHTHTPKGNAQPRGSNNTRREMNSFLLSQFFYNNNKLYCLAFIATKPRERIRVSDWGAVCMGVARAPALRVLANGVPF